MWCRPPSGRSWDWSGVGLLGARFQRLHVLSGEDNCHHDGDHGDRYADVGDDGAGFMDGTPRKYHA